MPFEIATEDGIDPRSPTGTTGWARRSRSRATPAPDGRTWLQWPRFQTFWEQVLRWSMRPATSNLSIRGVDDEGRGVVEVGRTRSRVASAIFSRARRTAPLTVEPVVLQQIGPGRYRTEFPIESEGSYLVNAILADPTGIGVQRPGGGVDALSIQLDHPRQPGGCSRSIAARTGGRVFDPEDLLTTDPFDRSGLEMPSSPTRIWDIVVAIAAVLFAADVAVRRLSIERRRTASRTAGGGGTVQAWRTARQASAHRQENGEPVDRRGRSRSARTARVRRLGESRLLGRGRGRRPTDAAAERRRRDVDGRGGRRGHDRRLLRAKRRARTDRERDDG